MVQVSYDWSKGAENHTPAQAQNFILLHPTQVFFFQVVWNVSGSQYLSALCVEEGK
jgi:hypothetical protein